jgi:acyl-CoA synthetase (AMP-forming)/AMP-acid ligase II
MRNPTIEAVVDLGSGHRLNYRQLNSRVNQTANALFALGLRPGERVGLLAATCTEFIETYYASAKIGTVTVLMNWRLLVDELEFLLTDSGATTLVFSAEFDAVVRDLHDRGTTSVSQWIRIGDAPLDAEWGAVSYDRVVAAASTTEPTIGAGGDDLLCLCYSSGTTGRPKGAMLTHEGQLFAVLAQASSIDGFHQRDRYLIALPLFHLGGILPLENAMYAGATVVLMRQFDPTLIWDVIASEHIDSGLVVPSMLNVMLERFDPLRHDCSSIKALSVAAAPVPLTLLEQCRDRGIALLQTYGLTEAGGPGTNLSSEDAERKIGSAGKAYMLTDVKIVRADATTCDPGEPGEIVIRARHLMTGYWNNPEATAQTIVNGWLHTGDIATSDNEGFITISDRIKDMIISGGENIYPAELENVILSHPGVREVAVIAQKSERWGETPLACVVRAHDDLRAEDVIAWCEGKLARFKMPSSVQFVDVIPRNPTGKALKRILRDQFA